ncbi:hypothetical protein [Synechococcus phage Ssp-JY38]
MGCGCGKGKVRRAAGTPTPAVTPAQRASGASSAASRTVQAISPYTSQQNVAPAHLRKPRRVV